jgi:hypothetical protein
VRAVAWQQLQEQASKSSGDGQKLCINNPFGNGKHTTYKNGDLGDGLFLFYPYYIISI